MAEERLQGWLQWADASQEGGNGSGARPQAVASVMQLETVTGQMVALVAPHRCLRFHLLHCVNNLCPAQVLRERRICRDSAFRWESYHRSV